MNVYDFDKTIFYPDSSCTFLLYCFRRFPRYMLSKLPSIFSSKSVNDMKENLFSVVSCIDDIDSFVSSFWDENFFRIQQWYINQKTDDDLIISASPDFLVSEAANRLHVRFIATPMNKYSGRILGCNCHDEEKVIRYNSEYSGISIDNFYSDSKCDTPMANLAENAYIVKKGKLLNWRK